MSSLCTSTTTRLCKCETSSFDGKETVMCGCTTNILWSHVKHATIDNVNTNILCPAREMFSAWSQLQPLSVPRHAGSLSPAILRLEAVVSNLTHMQRINGSMFLHDTWCEGHDAGPCHEGSTPTGWMCRDVAMAVWNQDKDKCSFGRVRTRCVP